MKYTLTLPERPFTAIKNGTKKVEGRTITGHSNVPYDKLKKGDILEFQNESTSGVLLTEVLYVNHYSTVKQMLIKEGAENVLSSEPKTVEHGIESYNSLTNYKENIEKHGMYAIGIKVV